MEWWLPPAKELPEQTFFNATQGGAACDGATRNCTTYEFSMGKGGPCRLWASYGNVDYFLFLFYFITGLDQFLTHFTFYSNAFYSVHFWSCADWCPQSDVMTNLHLQARLEPRQRRQLLLVRRALRRRRGGAG